jgi:hypothetical protein
VISNLIRWRSNVLQDVVNHRVKVEATLSIRLLAVAGRGDCSIVNSATGRFLGGLLGCRRFGPSGARDLRQTIRAFSGVRPQAFDARVR